MGRTLRCRTPLRRPRAAAGCAAATLHVPGRCHRHRGKEAGLAALLKSRPQQLIRRAGRAGFRRGAPPRGGAAAPQLGHHLAPRCRQDHTDREAAAVWRRHPGGRGRQGAALGAAGHLRRAAHPTPEPAPPLNTVFHSKSRSTCSYMCSPCACVFSIVLCSMPWALVHQAPGRRRCPSLAPRACNCFTKGNACLLLPDGGCRCAAVDGDREGARHLHQQHGPDLPLQRLPDEPPGHAWVSPQPTLTLLLEMMQLAGCDCQRLLCMNATFVIE